MKKSIVQQIASLPKAQQALVPEIKVEIEPVFEVTTPAPDMEPIASAIEKIMMQPPNVDAHMPCRKEPRKIKIDVERDGRGFIKSLMCTEINNV